MHFRLLNHKPKTSINTFSQDTDDYRRYAGFNTSLYTNCKLHTNQYKNNSMHRTNIPHLMHSTRNMSHPPKKFVIKTRAIFHPRGQQLLLPTPPSPYGGGDTRRITPSTVLDLKSPPVDFIIPHNQCFSPHHHHANTLQNRERNEGERSAID
ncbi:hypothetical protein CDAR_84121 [Caerostris darwini]|uniref:Uncharacterized protein n=1 Tax=Caerostris darwini TaxID=1538125 RepID=A0AAV4U653_9ARAC|nr:hypothetical protein CDAR_84121 [Caerostris darwini]